MPALGAEEAAAEAGYGLPAPHLGIPLRKRGRAAGHGENEILFENIVYAHYGVAANSFFFTYIFFCRTEERVIKQEFFSFPRFPLWPRATPPGLS